MATITVSPIHFEDYSGIQFERLVFAYHVRAGWRDLIWHGQSVGDQGRDISRRKILTTFRSVHAPFDVSL